MNIAKISECIEEYPDTILVGSPFTESKRIEKVFKMLGADKSPKNIPLKVRINIAFPFGWLFSSEKGKDIFYFSCLNK